MSKMALEPVRDWHKSMDDAAKFRMNEHVAMADAIDAELKAHGEPVAYQARWRSHSNRPFCEWEEVDKDSYEAEVESPNKNWEFRALYTAPPAPKIEVTVAMAKRAIEARNAYLQEHPGDTVDSMIAALEAALKETP